jgi:hypothetical protein
VPYDLEHLEPAGPDGADELLSRRG